MKYLLLITLLMVGCTDFEKAIATYDIEKCKRGVTYWFYGSTSTVMLDTNSKVIKCKDGAE